MITFFEELKREEIIIFQKLNAPNKVQDFLDTLSINFEKKGETLMSPRQILQKKTAHCMEGAIFAAAVLYFHNHEPLLMDLKTNGHDDDHVVALFKKDGFWGAISKTNHATLRYREPIYKTPRELAISYFHEYITDDGRKVMRSYSAPFSLQQYNHKNWLIDEKDLWYISDAIDKAKHYQLVNKLQIKNLRRANKIERQAGKLKEWKNENR
ncbi:MAG: hypothetical protein KGZ30_03540 [Anaplasmataceae bacterium]|nr:hypothetical protein [Anaplasmataceae bacterium]